MYLHHCSCWCFVVRNHIYFKGELKSCTGGWFTSCSFFLYCGMSSVPEVSPINMDQWDCYIMQISIMRKEIGFVDIWWSSSVQDIKQSPNTNYSIDQITKEESWSFLYLSYQSLLIMSKCEIDGWVLFFQMRAYPYLWNQSAYEALDIIAHT